jgi:hypothetical protein
MGAPSQRLAAALMSVVAVGAVCGCGGPTYRTGDEISRAWHSASTQNAALDDLVKHSTLQRMTLAQVTKILGKPSGRFDASYDAMTTTPGGFFWNGFDCRKSPRGTCHVLSLEFKNGRVVGANDLTRARSED